MSCRMPATRSGPDRRPSRATTTGPAFFSRAMLPRRIYDAFKDVGSRRVPLEQMVSGDGLNHNNSICRISLEGFEIARAVDGLVG